MSGGIAYVLDEDDTFKSRCNMAMVELEPVPEEGQVAGIRPLQRATWQKLTTRWQQITRQTQINAAEIV